ncbi:MAG: hypothetical protein P4L28_11890 [Paludibacteraceae bacterium]|nr:hypothetical protein [Paludibacteraceae bacterium]
MRKTNNQHISITPPPDSYREEGQGEAKAVSPGHKYIARWHFNYDQCDCITGPIEIIVVYPDQSYLFTHTNKWGTTTWNSTRCRHIELIRKVEAPNPEGGLKNKKQREQRIKTIRLNAKPRSR